MSRLSRNEIVNGILKNGYSYEHQCWVLDYVIQNCGHPQTMKCGCYGRQHAGQQAQIQDRA